MEPSITLVFDNNTIRIGISVLFGAISFFFICLSLKSFRKAFTNKFSACLYLVLYLLSFYLFIAYGVSDFFTGNGIDDATIYHLKYGLDGAGFMDFIDLILGSVTLCILGTVFLSWMILKKKSSDKLKSASLPISFILLFSAFVFNPAVIDIYRLEGYIPQIDSRQALKVSAFDDYYQTPTIASIDSTHKNVVFIYAESFERSYFDEREFPGLVKGLRAWENKSTSFTNIQQLDGTGWTVAGMTASQCGIPLVSTANANSMSGMAEFLSSAVCLGDLLDAEGYQLNYIGGTDLSFAGQGKLFKTHGFSNVLSLDAVEGLVDDPEYKTEWGIFDDTLLDINYQQFMALSEAGGKFGLFTATMDTHPPNGLMPKTCSSIKYKDGSNPILNAIACSDFQITQYINKISNSKFASNTIVVVASDHLSMRNTAYNQLKKIERRNLFMIIDFEKNQPQKIVNKGSTLDIGATLLPFLGYYGEIGLGRNLLGLNTEVEKDYIHKNMNHWKKDILKFWGFPKLEKSLEINVEDNAFSIDGRAFAIPAFIEFNNNLETLVRFRRSFYLQENQLTQYIAPLDDSKSFVLIDFCKNISVLDKKNKKSGYCMLTGGSNSTHRKTDIEKNIVYSMSDVKKLLQ